jgi:hypothetical protein
MSLKKTAEDLLQIANDIEKEAAEVTQFVCDKCNHTTTLAKINDSRKTAAQEVGENVTVSEITVNDKVTCPACDGVLSYKATDASNAYYYDDKVAEDAEEEEDKEEGKDASKKPSKEEIEEEKKETPAQQALEEKGIKLHKEPHTASIDYDKLDRYLKG